MLGVEVMPRGFGFGFFTPHFGPRSRPPASPSDDGCRSTPLQGAVTSRNNGPRRGNGGAAPGPKLGARVGLPMPPSRTPGSRAQCRPPRRPRGRRFGAPPGHQRAGRGRGAGTKGERESRMVRVAAATPAIGTGRRARGCPTLPPYRPILAPRAGWPKEHLCALSDRIGRQVVSRELPGGQGGRGTESR